MHMAAQGGHMLVAGLLISRSADSLFKTDKQGRTCVHLAAAYGRRDMVGLLLGQGAEINAADKVNLKVVSVYRILNHFFSFCLGNRNCGLLCTTPLDTDIWMWCNC
jgi:hypothetical protein